MPASQTPRTPQRRVGVYERLGRAGGSPAKTIGIEVVLLIILVAITTVLIYEARASRRKGQAVAEAALKQVRLAMPQAATPRQHP